MSSTQHQLIEQCATRLRGIVEALDNIHDNTPHRWSTDLDDVHSSAESLLALIKDQAPARSEASFEEWLANELEGEDGQPVPAAVCDIALARRAFNHWPKLEHPAKVCGVRFSAGVSSRLVVEAAQRLNEFESTPEQEAERPEVVAYRTIGRHTKHQHPHYALNYYKQNAEDQAAHWRERGCEVSEDELMTVAQHERIFGALRADRDSWAEQAEQRLADWDEMRKERDAALARVAELEALMQMNFGELHTARNLLSRLSVSGVNVDAILGGQLQDLVIVPADATLEMVEALKRSLTVTNRGTLLNAGHALNASIAASPFAKKAPEPVMCPRCEGEGTLGTGIDESPSTICKRCDGVGTIAAAPGNSVPQAWLDVQAERRRQITAEGWTPEHDDLYCAAELPRAAAAYILNGANDEAPAIWPFVAKWWKPRDARSNYVRASALILAEIERLDRAAANQGGPRDA
ncbi:hypothetical protein [Pseudomonas aeruginosa]|uniref:hypothetical protein n=1 Tax=Pseudomonas aeruginosa TaxID=287 RepID=UPI0030075DB4